MTNKSVAASCRTLSLKERIFVQELVDSVNEKVSYMAWVRKRKIKNEKLLRVEDRILVITPYRILTIGKRRGGVNKKICRNGHFFDLKKIHRFSINHMIVEFKTFVIDCFTDQSDDFISSIFKNYYPLVEGFPKDHKLIFEGNDEKVSQFQTQPNSIGKGFLKTYQGWCNYYQLQENQKIMDRIENDIIRSEDVEKQTVLDLSFLSEVLEISKDSKILLPISMALRFNKHFKEIYLSKVKIRTILSNFSQPIAHSNIIQKITFSKLKISEGFNSLGEAFCNQQLPLTFLDLSSNKMSDSNMKMFANGIEKLNSGLTYLDLSSNHLNPNSISILINALTKNKKHHNITHLNLSRNKFGNKGSLNFKNYLKTLKSNNKLNYLNLSNCKISLSLIVNSIIENKQTNCLKYLNLSDNKSIKKDFELIAKMCKKFKSIREFVISGCNLQKETISVILEQILSNKKISGIICRVDRNMISQKGAQKIKKIFQANSDSVSITELILDDCKLGNEGMVSICEGILKLESLCKLSLSRNFKNVANDKCIEKLSSVMRLENLRYFRLRGNKKYKLNFSIKNAEKFFGSLKENTNLQVLDLSGNNLGENNLVLLAESITPTTRIKELLFQNNLVTSKFLQKLLWSLKENDHLSKIHWPKKDLKSSLKSMKQKERRLLIKELKELKIEIKKILDSHQNIKIITITPDFFETHKRTHNYVQASSEKKKITTDEKKGKKKKKNGSEESYKLNDSDFENHNSNSNLSSNSNSSSSSRSSSSISSSSNSESGSDIKSLNSEEESDLKKKSKNDNLKNKKKDKKNPITLDLSSLSENDEIKKKKNILKSQSFNNTDQSDSTIENSKKNKSSKNNKEEQSNKKNQIKTIVYPRINNNTVDLNKQNSKKNRKKQNMHKKGTKEMKKENQKNKKKDQKKMKNKTNNKTDKKNQNSSRNGNKKKGTKSKKKLKMEKEIDESSISNSGSFSSISSNFTSTHSSERAKWSSTDLSSSSSSSFTLLEDESSESNDSKKKNHKKEKEKGKGKGKRKEKEKEKQNKKNQNQKEMEKRIESKGGKGVKQIQKKKKKSKKKNNQMEKGQEKSDKNKKNKNNSKKNGGSKNNKKSKEKIKMKNESTKQNEKDQKKGHKNKKNNKNKKPNKKTKNNIQKEEMKKKDEEKKKKKKSSLKKDENKNKKQSKIKNEKNKIKNEKNKKKNKQGKIKDQETKKKNGKNNIKSSNKTKKKKQ
ncbi:leucine-rich repeat isoform f [Anaeramoeba flamelloides]|uniref:Leucine-rich repeat isoform f n=1 Tax=Anaeramoeba flamelloides TaxID=1746091 RepID=A0AAV7YKT6_9EUKA|nr:leucine-rich repeat isoform f [Anaeramoeba flamelloides]